MENKVSNKKLAIIMYAIIFVVYNIILFLLVKNKNNVFWVSYIFMILFYAFFVFSSIYLFSRKEARVRFFGISLFSFSLYFLFAEFFLSTIMILFRNKIELKWAVILQILFIGIFSVIFVLSIMSAKYSLGVSNKYEKKVVDMKLLAYDVNKILNNCNSTVVKEKIRELYDIIKYSDPVGTSQVASVEYGIKDILMEMEKNINTMTDDDAIDKISKVINMCKERNEKLKITKM